MIDNDGYELEVVSDNDTEEEETTNYLTICYASQGWQDRLNAIYGTKYEFRKFTVIG